jgi:hypothetical protein
MLTIENTQAETSFGFDYTLIELFINFFYFSSDRVLFLSTY